MADDRADSAIAHAELSARRRATPRRTGLHVRLPFFLVAYPGRDGFP
jgi:hypothetical protein